MTLSRRAFLGSLLAMSVAGCSQVIDRYTQPDLPEQLAPPSGDARDPIAHLLSRATYGAFPGQIAQVRQMGKETWLREQLDYQAIDDDAVNWRLRRYDSLKFTNADIMGFSGTPNRRYIRDELAAATLVRGLYSKRQLYEVMVGFWSNHFSIFHFKGDTSLLKTIDDREVIRPHALGKFGDMLYESAHSPAMLIYLDNVINEKSNPNENYAREIMELHTLGVDGGYTEEDVKEVARCFTGWSVDDNGTFVFIEEWHDFEPKTVLGQRIEGRGGKDDGNQVLRILAEHPSTRRYISEKLVRYFIADEPPQAAIEASVAAWEGSDGDIQEILWALFMTPEFDNAPRKLKTPTQLLLGILRQTNAQYDGNTDLINRLAQLGHRPFDWTTPDGYPDTAEAWQGNMLGRWNLCIDATNNALPGVRIDLEALMQAGDVSSNEEAIPFFGRLFLKRDLTATEQAALIDFYTENDGDLPATLGLLLAGPAYQWR